MAKTAPKIVLSSSRDIPLDKLVLSQSNVRRIKTGISIEALAADIARRGLLQSLNARPMFDEAGQLTGLFEVPAGGRRYRALHLLVKQKLLARDAPVPCIVRAAANDILAEEDSLAENAFREALHPLDQFRGMQALIDKGSDIEAVAARFMTTPAVVRQRLKLASVSPRLHDVYADDEMSLDQLMAFTISEDHARQEEIWDQLEHSYDKSPGFIRRKLTENSVRANDKRALFVSLDAYVEAGGGIVRDLFESDFGGWLTDPALLDRLVDAKLTAEGERISAEGWKWVATAIDLPWEATRGTRRLAREEVAMSREETKRLEELEAEGETLNAEWADEHDVPAEVIARLDAIDVEIGALVDRPEVFDPAEVAIAGAFVSVDTNGTLRVERGFVRSEDEPGAEEADNADNAAGPDGQAAGAADDDGEQQRSAAAPPGASGSEEDEEAETLKPLPDRLVSDMTAWRTLALQDAFAQDPATAYVAVLHAFVIGAFYRFSHASCLQVAANKVYFTNEPLKLRDCPPARAIDARAAEWSERLPKSDADVWDYLLGLGDEERASLFAHCASLAVNAQAEICPKYDNGRVSPRMIAGRIAHSHVIARAVGLDLVEAGWRPTVADYFRSITKPQILADVADARGDNFAGMIDHLKKADMAREAERLLEDAAWLPVPLRTPGTDDHVGPDVVAAVVAAGGALDKEGEDAGVARELPAFLSDDTHDLALADGSDGSDLADGADDADDLSGDGDAHLPVAAE